MWVSDNPPLKIIERNNRRPRSSRRHTTDISGPGRCKLSDVAVTTSWQLTAASNWQPSCRSDSNFSQAVSELTEDIYDSRWKMMQREASRLSRSLRSCHSIMSTADIVSSACYTELNSQIPREIIIERKSHFLGFGFTLRHFIVYPPLPHAKTVGHLLNSDSKKPFDTIFVKEVKAGGPAQSAGLRTGDLIVAVNGCPISGKTYAQVVESIIHWKYALRLLVLPKHQDILQTYFSEIAQTSETNQGAVVSEKVPLWPSSRHEGGSNPAMFRQFPVSHRRINSETHSHMKPTSKEEKFFNISESQKDAEVHKNYFMDIYSLEQLKDNNRHHKSDTTDSEYSPANNNLYSLPLGYSRCGNGGNLGVSQSSGNGLAVVGSRNLQPVSSQSFQNYAYSGYAKHERRIKEIYPLQEPNMSQSNVDRAVSPSSTHHRPLTLNLNSKDLSLSSNKMKLPSKHNNNTKDIVLHVPRSSQEVYYDTSRTPVESMSSNRRDVVISCKDSETNLRRISYLKATKESDEVEKNVPQIMETMDTDLKRRQKSSSNTNQSSNSNLNNFRSLFVQGKGGDKSNGTNAATPQEVGSNPSLFPSMDSKPDEIFESWLYCKVASIDGKKAFDRSWKYTYVVLRDKIIYIYKDKKSLIENPNVCEETPVVLAEDTRVQIANDYTKRKNVFRIRTSGGRSEYMFQADTESIMSRWIHSIEMVSTIKVIDERATPGGIVNGSGFRRLASFRNVSPTGSSPPTTKSRKSSQENLSLKDKDGKITWKGKVVKKWKKIHQSNATSPQTHYPEGASIGVPLELCPMCPETDRIPWLVKTCCDIVQERGLSVVGVFRVPGNSAAINSLTETINDTSFGFNVDLIRSKDVNVVSSLLKLFFRKLPDPLFTVELYPLFIHVAKFEEGATRQTSIKRLIRELPEYNYETAKFVVQHLATVARHSDVNKMEVRNLAIIFGPTLVRTNDENVINMVTDMSQQVRLIELLILDCDWFFDDEEEEPKLPLTNQNYPSPTDYKICGSEQMLMNSLSKVQQKDVSTKDIVAGIISAANRKIQRGKPKKESNKHSRRNSESFMQDAANIVAALPQVMGGSKSPVTLNNPVKSSQDLLCVSSEFGRGYDLSKSSPSLTSSVVNIEGNASPFLSHSSSPSPLPLLSIPTSLGFSQATARRVEQFKAETKAMLAISKTTKANSDNCLTVFNGDKLKKGNLVNSTSNFEIQFAHNQKTLSSSGHLNGDANDITLPVVKLEEVGEVLSSCIETVETSKNEGEEKICNIIDKMSLEDSYKPDTSQKDELKNVSNCKDHPKIELSSHRNSFQNDVESVPKVANKFRTVAHRSDSLTKRQKQALVYRWQYKENSVARLRAYFENKKTPVALPTSNAISKKAKFVMHKNNINHRLKKSLRRHTITIGNSIQQQRHLVEKLGSSLSFHSSTTSVSPFCSKTNLSNLGKNFEKNIVQSKTLYKRRLSLPDEIVGFPPKLNTNVKESQI